MNKNKLVLNHCPNFYRIINCDYFEDDRVTEKLINIYEDFIFKVDIENNEELNMVKKIDFVLGKYVDDYTFRRKLQEEVFQVKITKTCTNLLRTVVENIIAIFNRYEVETTRKFYIARWI